ncbi:dermonecrotic toxin domain-containing protein [Luteibacter yeojuensis]
MDIQTTTHDAVQSENQASIDALRRLAATRDALFRLYEAQPTLVDASAQGTHDLLEALRGFWSAPRITTLAGHVADAMKEQAVLRGLDGTLDHGAASLAARVSALRDAPLPDGVHASELMLGNAAHAGSLIVVDDGNPGLALLFTAHGGWEAFDSLDRLFDSTRRRLLESVHVMDGTGLAHDEFADAKALGIVGSRDIAGGVFTTLATRLVEVQQGRIALAADDHSLDTAGTDSVTEATTDLGDRVRQELSPRAMLDIDAMEQLREAHLLEASVARRLANVPSPVRTAWYQARDAYNEALAAAGMLRAIAGVHPPMTLHAFASRELAVRLAAVGIDEAPETITIDVARIKVVPEALAALDPLPGSTQARRMSLVDFACQNIGRFSLETLRAIDEQDTSLGDRLGHGAIRDIVRELDIANRYQAHLEERLREGSTGALARKLTVAVQAAHMRLQAAEARLSYYLPGEPRSFIDDREERGFRWVEAALDAPASRRSVGGHDVVVSQVTYKEAPMDGILVFAAGAPNSVPRVVMYTPGAPDGLTFREFEDRQDAARRFLYHPAFREYLLDRLPAEFAALSPNGATRHFAGDRLAHWVLGSSGNVAYTLTDAPFGERQVQGDFLTAAYDATVEKYRRDTRFLARSTSGADKDALYAYLGGRYNVDPVANLVGAALAELPASLARVTQASWRFYDHVKAGDSGEAFVAFTEGYVNALNLVVPPFAGGRHVAGAIVRSRAAASGLASTHVRLTPPRARFEERYAARGLRKAGKPDDEGIFHARGQSYIEHDGTFFVVRHDAGYGRWRLAPAQGALDVRFTGPLIERIDGQWVFAHDAGLRGGMRRMRRWMHRLSVEDQAPPVAAPAAGVPAGPAPAAPQGMPLPPSLEPMRAEIITALTDNPSAIVLTRPDGTHLKFAVQPRSALLFDPHLHPDIADLTAHQRRVFFHEVDRGFPLVAERAEVMNIAGFARYDGRRVPSLSDIAHGVDDQIPSISSSTGEVGPLAPTLTPSQQQRWDAALAVARNTARRDAVASASGATTQVSPASEVLPWHDWPEKVWYFSERPFESEFWPAANQRGVTLMHGSVWTGTPNGSRTYPVSALPPETPTARLSDVLGTSPVHQAGRRDPLGYWVQIDMMRFHHRDLGNGHILLEPEPSFQVHRRILPSGEYQYTLYSERSLRIPSTHILSVGERGGRPAALPPIRQ